jgi:hypothetical protein
MYCDRQYLGLHQLLAVKYVFSILSYRDQARLTGVLTMIPRLIKSEIF